MRNFTRAGLHLELVDVLPGHQADEGLDVLQAQDQGAGGTRRGRGRFLAVLMRDSIRWLARGQRFVLGIGRGVLAGGLAGTALGAGLVRAEFLAGGVQDAVHELGAFLVAEFLDDLQGLVDDDGEGDLLRYISS